MPQAYQFGNTAVGFKTLQSYAYTQKFVFLGAFRGNNGRPVWLTHASYDQVGGQSFGKALQVWRSMRSLACSHSRAHSCCVRARMCQD